MTSKFLLMVSLSTGWEQVLCSFPAEAAGSSCHYGFPVGAGEGLQGALAGRGSARLLGSPRSVTDGGQAGRVN